MVVARMQWLVYSVDSTAVRESLFMNSDMVVAPKGSFLYQTLSDSTKLSLGCKKVRSVPLCLLERYFSNDATGHIAFPEVSYILPPVPSMSLITLFPWWFLSSSDVIFWTYLYLSATILITKSDTLSVWRFSWPLLQKYKITSNINLCNKPNGVSGVRALGCLYNFCKSSREIASLCWTAPFPTCLVFLSNKWKQLLAVSKPESEIMSNLLSLSFKNLLKLWRILSS